MAKPQFVDVFRAELTRAISPISCRCERCQRWAKRMAEGMQPRSRRSTRKPLLKIKVHHFSYLKHFSPDTTIKCTTSCRQYMNFLVSTFPNACAAWVRLEEGGGFNSNKHRSFDTKLPVVVDGPGRSPTSSNAKDYFTGHARFHWNSIIFWIKSGWIQSERVLRFYSLA